MWRVGHEIGHEHLERKDGCNRCGQKPHDDEHATEEFKHACKPHERKQFRRTAGFAHAAKPAEELLGAMLHEQKADKNARKRMRDAPDRATGGRIEEIRHRS